VAWERGARAGRRVARVVARRRKSRDIEEERGAVRKRAE